MKISIPWACDGANNYVVTTFEVGYLESYSLVNGRELLHEKSFLQRECVDGREAGTSVTLLTFSVLVINTDVLQLPNMSLEMIPHRVTQRIIRVGLNGVIWREGAELWSAGKHGDVGPHRVLRAEGQGDGGRAGVRHLGGDGGPAVTIPLLSVAWNVQGWDTTMQFWVVIWVVLVLVRWTFKIILTGFSTTSVQYVALFLVCSRQLYLYYNNSSLFIY